MDARIVLHGPDSTAWALQRPTVIKRVDDSHPQLSDSQRVRLQLLQAQFLEFPASICDCSVLSDGNTEPRCLVDVGRSKPSSNQFNLPSPCN